MISVDRAYYFQGGMAVCVVFSGFAVDRLEEVDTSGGQPCDSKRFGRWRFLKNSVWMYSYRVSTCYALAYLKRLSPQESIKPAQGNEEEVQ